MADETLKANSATSAAMGTVEVSEGEARTPPMAAPCEPLSPACSSSIHLPSATMLKPA